MKKQQIICYSFALQALKTSCQVRQNTIVRTSFVKIMYKAENSEESSSGPSDEDKKVDEAVYEFCEEIIKHPRIDEFRSIRKIVDEQAEKLWTSKPKNCGRVHNLSACSSTIYRLARPQFIGLLVHNLSACSSTIYRLARPQFIGLLVHNLSACSSTIYRLARPQFIGLLVHNLSACSSTIYRLARPQFIGLLVHNLSACSSTIYRLARPQFIGLLVHNLSACSQADKLWTSKPINCGRASR